MEAVDGGAEEISFKLRQAKEHSEECKKYIRMFWHNLLSEVDLSGINDLVARIEKHERSTEVIFKKVFLFLMYVLIIAVVNKVAKECNHFTCVCRIFRRH